MKRRRNVLKQTKGYRWGRKSKERQAREALLHAGTHAFHDRRKKKREFRALWQIKINAAARQRGLPYGIFMHRVKQSGIGLDRKILAELAEYYPAAFSAVYEKATVTT